MAAGMFAALVFSNRMSPITKFFITSDGTSSGTPTNITGRNYSLVIHRTKSDGDTPAQSYGMGTGLTVSSPATGEIDWTAAYVDIKTTLGPGFYYFFLQQIDTGAEDTPVYGTITIKAV